MKCTLKLTRYGMNMEDATLTQWLKAPGESFVAGDSLYEIETEKILHEVPAVSAGVMLEHLVVAGADVLVGAPVCVVDLESMQ